MWGGLEGQRRILQAQGQTRRDKEVGADHGFPGKSGQGVLHSRSAGVWAGGRSGQCPPVPTQFWQGPGVSMHNRLPADSSGCLQMPSGPLHFLKPLHGTGWFLTTVPGR